MIGKGATPSFFAIANDNYTLTRLLFVSMAIHMFSLAIEVGVTIDN